MYDIVHILENLIAVLVAVLTRPTVSSLLDLTDSFQALLKRIWSPTPAEGESGDDTYPQMVEESTIAVQQERLRSSGSVTSDAVMEMVLKRRGSGPPKKRPKQVAVTRPFKLVFISVLAITVLSIIGEAGLAQVWLTPTPPQQDVLSGLGFAWKAGVGAVFGLLGGKVA